jgi:integrase
MEKLKAPGLKWMKRVGGRIPVWVADEADVKSGYQPKTVNLSFLGNDPDLIIAKCNALQTDMLLFRAGHRTRKMEFDGTVRSLLYLYQNHEESPYHQLKPGSLRPYNHYLGRLEHHIGVRRVDGIDGIDIRRWHKQWSTDGKHLAAAAMVRAVLEAAVSFGVMMRLKGCSDLLVTIQEARRKLPGPRPRKAVLTPDQIVAARQSAHQRGRASSALAYALAFETTLRLWDVIGQWWPMDMGGISAVLDPHRKEKWFGLRWEDIDEDMVLRYQPSKTEDTTGKEIVYPLAKAPMVLEELAHWPVDQRTGPIIVAEEFGLPYRASIFTQRWSVDRKAAGISKKIWARDLRASGITEGMALNASLDDAGKVAGHNTKATTAKIYDRAVLEAADRFAEVRTKGRERSGNGSGNGR